MTIAPERIAEYQEFADTNIESFLDHRNACEAMQAAISDLLSEREQERKDDMVTRETATVTMSQTCPVCNGAAFDENVDCKNNRCFEGRVDLDVPLADFVRLLDQARPDAWSNVLSPPAASAQSVTVLREVAIQCLAEALYPEVKVENGPLDDARRRHAAEILHAAISRAAAAKEGTP